MRPLGLSPGAACHNLGGLRGRRWRLAAGAAAFAPAGAAVFSGFHGWRRHIGGVVRAGSPGGRALARCKVTARAVTSSRRARASTFRGEGVNTARAAAVLLLDSAQGLASLNRVALASAKVKLLPGFDGIRCWNL